jgi:hypothetical protein
VPGAFLQVPLGGESTRPEVLTTVPEIEVIAIHESGHACVAVVCGHPVIRVALDGVTTLYRRGDPHMHLGEAMIAFAGPLSESRFCRPSPAQQRALWQEEWHTDLANARRHLAAIGVTDEWVIMRQVRIMVRLHWQAIRAVAKALNECGALSGEEFSALMPQS